MHIEVGNTVVYPHHGAATVTALKTRVVKGAETTYVALRMHSNDLEIQVPATNLADVGVRDVIDAAGVAHVFAVLREDVPEDLGSWSRRFKANQEKLASGDVTRAAEVVRDLWRRDSSRGISTGEKAMLQKSRHVVEAELALALGCSENNAARTVTAILDESST